MNNKDRYKFETIAIHEGQEPEVKTGAVAVPIFQTSTFAQSSPGVHSGYEYSRTANPTRTALESCLARLENMEHGFAFASGSAATATIMHLFKTGDHVLCTDDCYGGTYRLFDTVIKNNGIEFDFVDMTSPDNVTEKIKENTKGIWIETPTNPLLKIIDLESIISLAKKNNLLSIVDNTFPSPYFQNPADFGADIVMHSTTKYINGHSDVVGGAALVSDKNLAKKMHYLQNAIGAIMGPMDSWLTLRGIQTLAVRMCRHEENAKKIAEFLSSDDRIERVIYPGLKSHPQHDIAEKQMSGFGGMISFYLRGGLKESKKFLEKVKIFTLAESLGGVESLIEHPAIMTHASLPEEARKSLGIDDNFIRISVGIENADDLITDLDQALNI